MKKRLAKAVLMGILFSSYSCTGLAYEIDFNYSITDSYDLHYTDGDVIEGPQKSDKDVYATVHIGAEKDLELDFVCDNVTQNEKRLYITSTYKDSNDGFSSYGIYNDNNGYVTVVNADTLVEGNPRPTNDAFIHNENGSLIIISDIDVEPLLMNTNVDDSITISNNGDRIEVRGNIKGYVTCEGDGIVLNTVEGGVYGASYVDSCYQARNCDTVINADDYADGCLFVGRTKYATGCREVGSADLRAIECGSVLATMNAENCSNIGSAVNVYVSSNFNSNATHIKETITNAGNLTVDEFGDAENGGIVYNTGDLSFNQKAYVSSMDSFGIIRNNGEMQINGRYKLESDSVGNNTIGDVVINNSGILNIKSNSNEESKIRGTIVNTGNMDIVLNSQDTFSGNISNNGGKFNLLGNFSNVFIYELINSGELNIDGQTTNSSLLYVENIIHNAGAKTYIKLGGDNKEYNENSYWTDEIRGTITGSNSGDFKLVLEKGSEWNPFDFEFYSDLYQGNLQVEPVSGIELDGGTIAFSLNSYIPFDTLWWYDKYGTLTLNDFSSNGNFGVTTFGGCDGNEFISGGICLFTDLQNNVGDKVVFTGSTPDATIPIGIYNKNDNGGIPIVREDGHSVTIIEAPSDTKMQFKTSLLTYGNPSQEFLAESGMYATEYGADPIDPDNYKVYKPQIDELIEGNTKYWNFVGWEEAEDNRDNKKAPQEAIEHSILVEDIEPIFKRFNDLRTDPSEVGVWMRGETGETKIRNLSYDHNVMSGGYDWERKNDDGILFTGVGFTYSTNECDDKAIGDTKGYGVNIYGSWLGKKNNDYVDLVVKYGKLDKSYAGYDENNIFVSGDYDKDLFTVSAKYGRRIFKDDWYYEPSVGLAWGKVGSANFTDNYNTPIHADASYSTIASLGMQVGKNIKGIEYYGKAEVMHDFDGKIHVSAPGRSVEDDMGGTWVKCAIGASRKIDENNSFYLEVERDFGNKVEKPYGFSAGYRFTW